MAYAASTTVPVDRTRAEIERTLQRYGAISFAYGYDADRAMIQFSAHGRQVRFALNLPSPGDRRFTHHARGARTADAARVQWEQACRQRWRPQHWRYSLASHPPRCCSSRLPGFL